VIARLRPRITEKTHAGPDLGCPQAARAIAHRLGHPTPVARVHPRL